MHAVDAARVLAELAASADGLTQDDAEHRLAAYGPNALRSVPGAPAWKILVAQMRGVVTILLIIATVVALLMNEVAEAIAVAAVIVVNTVVGFVTEWRARRAMEALLRLAAPRATVVRDGRTRDIAAVGVVPGDVIVVEAGQAIPADARLLEATDFCVNESALTGESLPVTKRVDTLHEATPLAERANMLFKGTTALTGTARAVVAATGMDTELGKIGALVAAVRTDRTPLERRLDVLGQRLIWVAAGSGLLVIGAGVAWGASLGTMIETGIALAIAAVPEGLPVVATVALAVGMRRMARRKALVRRAPSVETLGSVTVICTDKTGTLTAGEMTVTDFAFADRDVRVSGAGYEAVGEFFENETRLDPTADGQLRLALHVTALANRADVELGEDGWVVRGDPTEAALIVASRKAGLTRGTLLETHPEAGEVPFSSERMLMATFHHVAGDGLLAHVKGAPDRVLALCTRVLHADGEHALTPAGRSSLLARNDALAAQGLRVLALASGTAPTTDETALRDLTFVALAGMIDTPAPGVRETIAVFRQAGMRTIMITGDQRSTARAVARDLGILADGQEVLDGAALGRMTDAELADQLRDVVAFSRVAPRDKLAIVTALQRRGEIVAMLGDGVNDAPALKRADVGVAMGVRGSDVAKEAASVVLQDDRFATIGAAVEEGRVIFDNIRKVVFYLFSCNVAEILVLSVAAVGGFAMPLLPLQILWLNIVTDTFPALSLSAEPAEGDVMRRPPRNPEAAILSRRFTGAIFIYAAMIAAVTLAAFGIAVRRDGGAGPAATTMAFATLGVAQGLHLGNARRRSGALAPASAVANPWALAALALVVALQIVAVEWSPLSSALGTHPMAVRDWGIAAALGAIPAMIGQAGKYFRAAADRGSSARASSGKSAENSGETSMSERQEKSQIHGAFTRWVARGWSPLAGTRRRAVR